MDLVPRKYTLRIQGDNQLFVLVARLAYRSQWFAVMPLPDDEYDVSVREENEQMLITLANSP